MTSAEQRTTVTTLIDEATAAGARQARACVQSKMMFALGANLEILIQAFFPDDLAAALAFQPQAFGANALFAFSATLDARFLPVEPGHRQHKHYGSIVSALTTPSPRSATPFRRRSRDAFLREPT